MAETRVNEEHGEFCGNCGTWRRLTDDYFIEKCPKCGDDETYIFDVDEAQEKLPMSRLPNNPTDEQQDEINDDFDDRFADDAVGVYDDSVKAWESRRGAAIED